MRFQGGVEAMMVVSALLLILFAMSTYAYYTTSQLNVMQEEADYFETCSKLQTLLVSSSLSDRNITSYFLYNMTVDGDILTAYTEDPNIQFVCPILLPVNGSIIIPQSWYYPVNGTKLVSRDGVVNITWGWYT